MLCYEIPMPYGTNREVLETPDVRNLRQSWPGAWLVATYLNNVPTIIRLAAEVSELQFGKDVIVEC
jgi:hypothetical protein